MALNTIKIEFSIVSVPVRASPMWCRALGYILNCQALRLVRGGKKSNKKTTKSQFPLCQGFSPRCICSTLLYVYMYVEYIPYCAAECIDTRVSENIQVKVKIMCMYAGGKHSDEEIGNIITQPGTLTLQ